MPQVGFEPMIPVFERAKTVRALERTATVIGLESSTAHKIKESLVTLERTWQAEIKMALNCDYAQILVYVTTSTVSIFHHRILIIYC
jgi:hypothetical protein